MSFAIHERTLPGMWPLAIRNDMNARVRAAEIIRTANINVERRVNEAPSVTVFDPESAKRGTGTKVDIAA